MEVDDPGGWCLLIAGVCVLLTLFFSTSHLALRHVSWVKFEERLSKKGCAEKVRILRDRLDGLIDGTAVLRLLTNLTLVLCVVYYYLAGVDVAANEPAVSSIRLLMKVFVGSAVLLSVFSVAVPHAWARYAGTSVLVHCYPVLILLERIVWPLTTVLKIINPIVRRLAGVSGEIVNGGLEERQEELLNVVEEGEKQGVVDEEEREMIASVLEFRDTTAGEIMTPRTEVVGIEVSTSLSEAVETVIRAGHSRYPIYEHTIDKISGMLYAKDLLSELNHPDGSGSIGHRLRKSFFVPESKTLRTLLHDFQNQKVHMAVVLDEYGGTAGVVTIEDILEELVGEIEDEYETGQVEPIRRIDENTIEVDARCEVDELNDQFDLAIPEDEDYETIGGFAFARLGSIPKAGETFEHENLRFTIIEAGERKIDRLRIFMSVPGENEESITKYQ